MQLGGGRKRPLAASRDIFAEMVHRESGANGDCENELEDCKFASADISYHRYSRIYEGWLRPSNPV
jgi:hypothetical protein